MCNITRNIENKIIVCIYNYIAVCIICHLDAYNCHLSIVNCHFVFRAAITKSDNAVQNTYTTQDPTGNKCSSTSMGYLQLGFALEESHNPCFHSLNDTMKLFLSYFSTGIDRTIQGQTRGKTCRKSLHCIHEGLRCY